uniref:Secreted protein n=1 Tax=Lepeophtheirus salmonis TaxID=72036 RepID=A0A0K2VAQ0_LEPSM
MHCCTVRLLVVFKLTMLIKYGFFRDAPSKDPASTTHMVFINGDKQYLILKFLPEFAHYLLACFLNCPGYGGEARHSLLRVLL